jgi:glycosyltransferase involved in cell wall biosynthesis
MSKTALIVSHAANRSGAPQNIYHIIHHLTHKDGIKCIIFSLQDGPMMEDFREIGEAYVVKDNVVQGVDVPVKDFLESLQDKPAFAFINTACCARITPEIRAAGVPVVTLIHDYTYAFNEGYLSAMYDFSDQIVYSTQFMIDKNIQDYSFDLEKTSIIPQGLYKDDFLSRDLQALRKELRKELNIPEDAFVVLGSGSVYPRKGVDIYIMSAIQTLSDNPGRDIYFIWIGGKLSSNAPDQYVRFLSRDIVNSGFSENIRFMGEINDVLPYYAFSDLLFLCSREDPFPTIVMEAFAAEIPVLGMEGSSGSIALLKRTDNFVAPYANIREISEMLVHLYDNPELRKKAALKGKQVVKEEFNFDHYVIRLKELVIKEFNIQREFFKVF